MFNLYPSRHALLYTGITLYLVLHHIITSYAVGLAAHNHLLMIAAFPFSLILILSLCFLPKKSLPIAWAGLTLWLGSTYLSTGAPEEYAVLLACAVFAALGLFKSPYYFALPWLLHPLWDFLPRQLPPHLHDLPMACLVFDIPVGLYLWWASYTGQLKAFSNNNPLFSVAKFIYVLVLLILFSLSVVYVAGSGLLIHSALPIALVLIVALAWLDAKTEWIAWAIMTGWLAMTYAHSSGPIDIALFFILVAFTALGVFQSVYWLLLTWLLLIPWNLLPRQLPEDYTSLPVAFMLFQIPIMLYLFYRARIFRWSVFNPGR